MRCLPRKLIKHDKRTTSFGSNSSAIVRHFHKKAESISKVEHVWSCGGRCFRIDLISFGPKKKDQWTMSLFSIIVVHLLLFIISYSWWIQVILGGSRAFKICLCHTGCFDGIHEPLAISATVLRNCTNPSESLIVWFSRTAKMNPPHVKRVTCNSLDDSLGYQEEDKSRKGAP